MTDEQRATGRRIRREVLGEAHVEGAESTTTPFNAAFQDFITRTAWGDVWARPGLDRRTRSAITLAMLTAMRADGEIAMHVRGAIRNGLSADEISEILLHSAIYAGVPAANAAFAIAGEVLAEPGLEDSDSDEPATMDGQGRQG